MRHRILVLHGPNLNLLGEREPEIYGSEDLAEIDGELLRFASKIECDLEIYQSNHEGELIDLLHQKRHEVDGVVINPGAYAHYSYALRDAIASIKPPTIEVHFSDISDRETFRKTSVTAPACLRMISGKGLESYREAIESLNRSFREGRTHGR